MEEDQNFLRSIFKNFKRRFKPEDYKIETRINEFKKLFPNTPPEIGLKIEEIVDSLERRKLENNSLSLKEILIPLANTLQFFEIDVLNQGSSAAACYDFSVKLRDVSNYALKKLGCPSEAYLINGDFGTEKESDDHFWVAVVEQNAIPEDIQHKWNNILEKDSGEMLTNEEKAEVRLKLDKAVFVDGTADQYLHWQGLDFNPVRKYYYNLGRLFWIEPGDEDLRKLYKPRVIAPAFIKYFGS